MVWILDSDLSGGRMATLMLMATITVLAWVLIKPLRRLRNMVAGAVGDSPISHDQWRLERVLRRLYRPYRRRWGRRQPAPAPARTDQHQGGPDEQLRWRSMTSRTSFTVGSPRPETTPAEPVIHTHSQRVHTPDPYRRAELEQAPPPPASGPRTPSGSGDGGRAEAGPVSPATDRVIRLPASPMAGVASDLVVPSDLDQRDHRTQRSENQADPPVTTPETSEGQTVYRIYRPSTHRTEPDTPADSPPADGTSRPSRPEASDPSGWRSIPHSY
jgi:hypothetical protein